MTPVGQFVSQKRHALGMTQTELAQITGVDGSYINRIERGGKCPGNFIFLERLAKSLQLSPNETTNLLAVAKLSQRTVRLPANLSLSTYAVADSFISALEEMSDEQIQFLDSILNAMRRGLVGGGFSPLDIHADETLVNRKEPMHK